MLSRSDGNCRGKAAASAPLHAQIEGAQAGAECKCSPRPLTGTHRAPLLTCSLLRAGVVEGPCCPIAGGLSPSSILSADSACRQAAAGLKHG